MKKKLLTTIAALLAGSTANPVAASPTAGPDTNTPAIVRELDKRPVMTKRFRASLPNPKAIAARQRWEQKRAAKRAMRRARREGRRITWRTAHRDGEFWVYLMTAGVVPGGARARWATVHAAVKP